MIRYVIVDSQAISNAMINISQQTSVSTSRKSSDGLGTILKFDDNDHIARELFMDKQWLSHEEIKEIINGGW